MTQSKNQKPTEPVTENPGRRHFLRKALTVAGLLAGGAILAGTACRCDEEEPDWSDQNKEQSPDPAEQPPPQPPPEDKPIEPPPPEDDPPKKKSGKK
jgi:uncharacterized membrane protein YebE (DUF533 family)